MPNPLNHIKIMGVGAEAWLHVYILSIDWVTVGFTPIRRRNGRGIEFLLNNVLFSLGLHLRVGLRLQPLFWVSAEALL